MTTGLLLQTEKRTTAH